MNQAKPAKERVCSSITQKKLFKENKRITSGNRRKARDVRVLAERNPAVAPVAVWVESGDESLEHPAVRTTLSYTNMRAVEMLLITSFFDWHFPLISVHTPG